MRPLSTNPMWSYPTQHALATRVHEAKEQDEHEDTHLDQPEAGIPLALRRPRKDEHCLHVAHHEKQGEDGEHDEQQGEDVVTDLALGPTLTDRVDAALVRGQLLDAWLVRPDERRNPQQ